MLKKQDDWSWVAWHHYTLVKKQKNNRFNRKFDSWIKLIYRPLRTAHAIKTVSALRFNSCLFLSLISIFLLFLKSPQRSRWLPRTLMFTLETTPGWSVQHRMTQWWTSPLSGPWMDKKLIWTKIAHIMKAPWWVFATIILFVCFLLLELNVGSFKSRIML